MAELTPEDELTGWLRRRVPGGGLLGDDSALLASRGPIAVTVDQQVAGTHFPADLDPRWVARRLLEVNLSDLAASGARPRYVLSTIAAPAGFDHRRFLEALGTACRRRGVEMAGGDLASSERLVLTLTAIGEVRTGARFVPRSTARPGDRLWLGGQVGLSAVGRRLVERGARPEGRSIRLPRAPRLAGPQAAAARRAVRRHLAPSAQVELGQWLARRRRSSAIDVSDGLALDLARLCRESGCGAELDPDAIALDRVSAALASRLGLDPLETVLGGGEDYVLLFALPRAATPPKSLACRPIGRIVEGRAIRLAGVDQPLDPSGWSHL